MNIIITGASRGIGFETARLLAENPDHTIIAIARNREGLDRLQSACLETPAGGKIHTIRFDLLKGNITIDLLPDILEIIEKVDILINNAGTMVKKQLSQFSHQDFDQVFGANIKGPFFLIQALLPVLSRGGHILNIGSMGGFQGSAKFPGLSLYSASKGALAILSECLAEELKGAGISVNCLALGSAQTEMLAEAFPGYQAPLSAPEMAKFMADFALNGHRYFNGKVLPVALSVP